jgi:acetamidase/formamidase
MTGRNQFGQVIALHPFMGVMGVAPAEPGLHATAPPRATGGNIDCKELVAGSTLYLPVRVPGALFSVGDGHGAQGDGEVSKTAVECPMEHVSLTFTLEDQPLALPRANAPAGWITFGFHPDLNEATVIALDEMLTLLGTLYGVERPEALALASVLVDLRVTQIANGVHGVHALLPHGALRT